MILLQKKLQIGRKNATKNEKKIILNEYISLTGFNRKYAITKINSCIKRKTYIFNNKIMNSCKVEVPKRKKRKYIPKKNKTFQASLIAIWGFSHCADKDWYHS